MLKMGSSARQKCFDKRSTAQPVPSGSYDDFKATLEEKRSILRGVVSCSIPEISLESFMNNLLPPLRDGIDIGNVVSSLRTVGQITIEDRWRAFEIAPESASGTEGLVFAPISDIFRKVIEFASSDAHPEPTSILLLSYNASSNSQKARVHPGGYFILREAEERAHISTEQPERKMRWWYDIALTTEFKKTRNNREQNENVSKLMFNIQQTMTLDPCRRFTFGITIENTEMRLWFCSRATPVVSQTFDFTTDVKLLTRVFLSFAFASKEQLGWDPTMQPFFRSSGERAYRIKIENETYETESMLSDFSTDALVSHATRVWTVRHVPSQVSYVLKDVWLDEDRDPEHIIRGTILAEIQKKYGVGVRQEAASHLLTPVAHWFVPINGEHDHTTDIMMRGYTPSMKHRFKIRVKKATGIDDSATSNGDTQSSRRELRAPFPRCLHRRKVYRRKHYRVLFKEVAQDLYRVRTLSEAFTVLKDGTKVMKWIHGCGWVHRDISAGNLYLYNGRGLIGDFEYAKRRNTDISKELPTGTPDFTSVEAVRRAYDHLPDNDDVLLARLSSWAGLSVKEIVEKLSFPFFHNDLHDLESIWWIATWVLFFNRVCRDLSDEEQDYYRLLAAKAIFHIAGSPTDRTLFFQTPTVFEEQTAWVPDELRDMTRFLNAIRRILLVSYEKFEKELPEVRTDVFEGIHEKLLLVFDACKNTAIEIEVALSQTLVPQHHLSFCDGDEYVYQNLNVPSLEHDSEGEMPDSSFSDSDKETGSRESSMIDVSGATKHFPGLWKTNSGDFTIPMPSFCISRYEFDL
ncbi:hypothetical protein ACEPAI_2366 [Sanghuangporus weigelae]